MFQTAFDLLRRKLPCICCKMWCTFELWDRATGNWVVQSRINVILKEICAVQGGDGGYMARMTSWDINSNRNGHCRVHIWNMFFVPSLACWFLGIFLDKGQGNCGTRASAAKNWYFWMNLKKKWIGEWKWNFDLVDACLQTSRLTMVSNNVYFATAKKGLKGCACAGVPGHYLQKPPGLQVLAAGWPRAP